MFNYPVYDSSSALVEAGLPIKTFGTQAEKDHLITQKLEVRNEQLIREIKELKYLVNIYNPKYQPEPSMHEIQRGN